MGAKWDVPVVKLDVIDVNCLVPVVIGCVFFVKKAVIGQNKSVFLKKGCARLKVNYY